MNRPMAGPALLLIAIAVLMTGCAANVVTDYKAGASYDSYETWAFGASEDNRYTSLDGARVQEGQLIIDLVDTDTDTVVWRGTSKRYLNQNQSPETREKLINEVVAEMFSRYPPGE